MTEQLTPERVSFDEWDEDEELGCADLETRLDAAFEREDRKKAKCTCADYDGFVYCPVHI
jgi:hypothetical protein